MFYNYGLSVCPLSYHILYIGLEKNLQFCMVTDNDNAKGRSYLLSESIPLFEELLQYLDFFIFYVVLNI